MRKGIQIVFICVLFLVLFGCSNTAKVIQPKTFNEKTDVFTETKNSSSLPETDFAVLTIKATIKTHVEGYYWLESKDSRCGKPGYPFLLNIAGQAVLWKVDGQKEILPRYDQDGKASRDPDAGEGVKYVLEKKIKIHTGTYKVFLGLPNENYVREVEMSIQNGKIYTLDFRPVYKEKTFPTRLSNFTRGIKDLQVYLDGTPL